MTNSTNNQLPAVGISASVLANADAQRTTPSLLSRGLTALVERKKVQSQRSMDPAAAVPATYKESSESEQPQRKELTPGALMVLLNQRNLPIPHQLQKAARKQMGVQYPRLLMLLLTQREKLQLDKNDRLPFDDDSIRRLLLLGVSSQELSSLHAINELDPAQRQKTLATEADFIRAYRQEVASSRKQK